MFKKKLEANELKEPESANDLTLQDDEEEETPSEQFEKIKLGWGIRKPLPIRRFSLPRIPGKVRVEFSRYVELAAVDKAFTKILKH